MEHSRTAEPSRCAEPVPVAPNFSSARIRSCFSRGMLPARPPRLQRFAYRGPHRYFVTCCVAQRIHVFTNPDVILSVQAQLVRTAAERSFSILAYCFMPDHWHGLVEGTRPDADFRAFMKCFRQRAAVSCPAESCNRLWQPGYFERALRVEEATPDVMAYILDNPVRAGLVERRKDHPYSWCAHGFEL